MERGPAARRAILSAIVVAVPIVFFRPAYQPFNVPKFTVLALGLIVVSGIRALEITQGASASGLRRIWIPAVAVSGPLIVSWALSPFSGWSLFGTMGRFEGLIPYMAAIALGVLVADAFPGHLRQLAWAVTASGASVGLYAAFQWLGLDLFDWARVGGAADRASSTLGNSNFTGGFLGLTLPIGAGLALVTNREGDRRALFMLIPLVAGWVGAFSQGGWAGGCAGLLFAASFWFASDGSWKRRLGLSAAGLILLATIAAVPVSRAVDSSLLSSARARSFFWETAVATWQDDPVVGVGPNYYSIVFWEHRPEEEAIDRGFVASSDPHSVFLSMLANEGLLGALGFLVAVGWALWKGFELPIGTLQAAFAGALVAYLVQSFVSIDDMALRSSFWLAIGAIAAARVDEPVTAPKKRRSKRVRSEPLRRPWLVAIVASVVLGASLWTTNFFITDVRMGRVLYLFAAGDFIPAQNEARTALGFRADYEYRGAYGSLLIQSAASQGTGGVPYLEEATDVLDHLPGFPDPRAIRDYASALHVWANVDPAADAEAVALYRRIIEVDPYNAELRVETADVLLSMKRYDDALAMLLPVVERDELPSSTVLATVYGGMALAHAFLGDEAEALAAVERAEALGGDPRAADARALLEGEGAGTTG